MKLYEFAGLWLCFKCGSIVSVEKSVTFGIREMILSICIEGLSSLSRICILSSPANKIYCGLYGIHSLGAYLPCYSLS